MSDKQSSDNILLPLNLELNIPVKILFLFFPIQHILERNSIKGIDIEGVN